MTGDIDVLVSEVEPRDGLQNARGVHADRIQEEMDLRCGRSRIARDRGLLVRAAIGEKLGGAHPHNTRGLGLANVVAALEVGVTKGFRPASRRAA